MNVLERNYYRLLRKGAFGEDEPLEQMSRFKWNKLYSIAEKDDVAVYITGEYKPNLPILEYDMSQHRRFRSICEKERHSIDTSPDSLELLSIILYNTEQTISRNTSLRAIIELGRFLRIKGDKVDFIKIEAWIKRLGIRNMASLHGSVLISLFNFTLDELPFMQKAKPKAANLALHDRKLTRGYLTKYPMATMHSWGRTVYRSITQIEE